MKGCCERNNGWEACREDEVGRSEETPFSCSLKNEKGPVMKWERKPAREGCGKPVRGEVRQAGHSQEFRF